MKRQLAFIIMGVCVLLVSACAKTETNRQEQPAPLTFIAFPTPTPTPPVAIWVNDTPIFQESIDTRVSEIYLDTSTDGIPPISSDAVLSGMIDQTLMAQIAAETPDVAVSEPSFSETILAVEASIPAEQLTRWLTTNNLSEMDFRDIMRSEMMAQQLFQTVTRTVPATAKQIHAQCLKTGTQSEAENITRQLAQGASFADFATIACTDRARKYGADLGWFPTGVGLLPADVEAWAFSLPIDSTEVFSSTANVYILRVSAMDEDRALTPEYHYQRKVEFFENWFDQQRSLAKIERMTN